MDEGLMTVAKVVAVVVGANIINNIRDRCQMNRAGVLHPLK